MSRDQHSTGDTATEISEERARAIDDVGRRAGAALRSPAPADGAATIHGRAQRRRAVRGIAATTGVAVLIVAGVVALKAGDQSSDQQPVDTVTSTTTNSATTSPATTTPEPTTTETTTPEPTTPETTSQPYLPETQAVVRSLIDALNTAVIDDVGDLAAVRALFTDDATIHEWVMSEPEADSEPLALDQWLVQLRAWAFDGVLSSSCIPSVGTIPGFEVEAFCRVEVRWATLLAEADDFWWLSMVGDRIQTLVIQHSDDRNSATLPLSVRELEGWEQWLRETDPETAARLVPSVGIADHPGVTRYDPALAPEMNTSIQQYLDARPPDDEIRVMPDLVEVGDRLIVVTMARADGRSYVLVGRPETRRERETGVARQAVLAAFDEAGGELWRIDLVGCPTAIAVVGDVVWVGSLNCSSELGADNGNLTRVDAANGAVLGTLAVDEASYMVGAFGSLWLLEGGNQLSRVDPDLSKVAVASFPDRASCDDCNDFTAGNDAIWVPLGAAGVAVIDTVTYGVRVIPGDEIGHDALKVAIDGDVAYVASSNRVASIVDGKVRATTTVGVGVEISYLGPIDGRVGALLFGGQFVVLKADDPMIVARVQSDPSLLVEIDGDGWTWMSKGDAEGLGRVTLP